MGLHLREGGDQGGSEAELKGESKKTEDRGRTSAEGEVECKEEWCRGRKGGEKGGKVDEKVRCRR